MNEEDNSNGSVFNTGFVIGAIITVGIFAGLLPDMKIIPGGIIIIFIGGIIGGAIVKFIGGGFGSE